jgi:hypothetical protein
MKFKDIKKSLRESSNTVNEDEDLLEVKMSPGELKRWAQSPEAEGIQAGFEAELIFRDTSRDDDEGESEPDMDADERAGSIDSVVEFFMGGDMGIGRNTANRVRDRLYEELYDWQMEQIDQEWDNEAEDQVREWMRNNISPNEYRDQAVEELGISGDPTEDQQKAIDRRAAELFDQAVDSAIEDQDDNYDRARDEFYDYRRDDTDYDEESFLSDRYRYMSDIGDAFSLDWPYWTEGSSSDGGGRTTENIADSLSRELGGAEVRASSGYHSTSRKPGRWIIEPDGSLEPDDYEDAGLEVVSPPMPLLETLQALNTVIDWANSDGDAYTNGSTGLHMGVSIPYKGGDVDYVKLILFMGDKFVLDRFGRSANSYCRSALEKLISVQRGRRENSSMLQTSSALDLMRSNLIELAADLVRNNVGQDKYTSAHIKDGYIEFRSPGGDYLAKANEEIGALEETMLRFSRSMYIAGRPDVERKEYSKKLYKLLDAQESESLKLFVDYSTGRINQEELKKSWAQQVLAKEQPETRTQTNQTEYDVYTPADGQNLETFSANSDEDAIDYAQNKYSGQGIEYKVRVHQTPEKKLSRRAEIAKKIATRPTVWHVENTNSGKVILVAAKDTDQARYIARNQDGEFNILFLNDPDSFLVKPATSAEVKQYQVQQADNAKDSEQIQARIGQPQPAGAVGDTGYYKVRWRERRNGQEVEDSLNVDAENANVAMDRVRSALQAQRRDIVSIEANPQEPPAWRQRQQAQQPTVSWADQLQRELSQQAGTWTGHWIVQDGQGRELTRFHGIGNNQSDANRHAARWLGTNRPDLAGQEIEVVPEVR